MIEKPKKELKRLAAQLSLLMVQNDIEMRALILKNLSGVFKEIVFETNAKDAFALYKYRRFDLIAIDIDTVEGDPYQLINSIQLQDFYQPIAVCSARVDDAPLLLSLLNMHIAGFIPKNATVEERLKICSEISRQALEHKIMYTYVEYLENQYISLKKAELKQTPIIEVAKQAKEESFLMPSTNESVDTSIYKDYFSFLDSADRDELYEQLDNIDELLFTIFKCDNANVDSINYLGDSLMRFGNILLRYQFSSDMGSLILELAKSIIDNSQTIIERLSDFEALIYAFCSNLRTYLAEVWDKESDNPKFFNDSIVSDAKIIIGMLAPSEVSDASGDLLFF